jgi:hypothetical protein
VRGKRTLNLIPADRRQVDDTRPGILITAAPLEQLARLQPVDRGRNRSASKPHRSAQVVDWHRTFVKQRLQDSKVRQTQAQRHDVRFRIPPDSRVALPQQQPDVSPIDRLHLFLLS